MLVEGQTEERFVKDVLQPHLQGHDLLPIPTIVTTKRVKSGPDFKGGITEYVKVERDLRRLLGDTNAIAVTTLIDYYGLPQEFPGMATRPAGTPGQRVRHVETEWERQINARRFRAYLSLHEFEALLFANSAELAAALNRPDMAGPFQAIRAGFPTPEDINEGQQTAPSKRIRTMFPGYQKTLHGPLVTSRVGIEVLRRECHHFAEWVGWLEGLAA